MCVCVCVGARGPVVIFACEFVLTAVPRPLPRLVLHWSLAQSCRGAHASVRVALCVRYAADGGLLSATDFQYEPAKGKPFPGVGIGTDRWFQFRAWYCSPAIAATRRLFLDQRVRGAACCLWRCGVVRVVD